MTFDILQIVGSPRTVSKTVPKIVPMHDLIGFIKGARVIVKQIYSWLKLAGDYGRYNLKGAARVNPDYSLEYCFRSIECKILARDTSPWSVKMFDEDIEAYIVHENLTWNYEINDFEFFDKIFD